MTGISASARRDVVPGGTGMRNVPGRWRGVAISCGERCVAFTFPGVDWVCTSMTVEEIETDPTHLLEEEVVVEIVQAKAAAARTSADDKTSAIAMRIGAVTNRDGEEIARRNIVPDVTGTRT